MDIIQILILRKQVKKQIEFLKDSLILNNIYTFPVSYSS